MASINGIVIKGKKNRRADGSPYYTGGLYAKGPGGLEKIGGATQRPDGTFAVYAERGFSLDKIREAITGFGGEPFDMNMYRLFTLAEFDRWYHAARHGGYDGLGVMECDSRYIGRYLTKSENAMTMKDIENLMRDERKELETQYPGEKIRCEVFSFPVDFMLGQPVSIEELKATDAG